ncbi:PAS domain S-box protein [Clostridium sp. D2Q-14]|uniref:ATP-binding protein n=1 Tax=Anaeromonas gelatinilytica TaxID=2683194 RepID=UPI00193B75E7|nr:ATP-binding protein [Anaeromonas gelatinilytica]MBS4534433.1 PAS domain S-box protein [Anaeromonas gelatinilytica]
MKMNSLKFKIPLFIVIFAVFSVTITGISTQRIVSNGIQQKTLDKNLLISEMISNEISIYLEDAKVTVETASNFSSQSFEDTEYIQYEIFRIYDNFPYFDLIFYMNNKADMVFSKPSNEHVKNKLYIDRSYYWDVMNTGKTSISPLLISSVLERPHFIIASPVRNNSKEIIGLIGAGIPLYNIQGIIDKTQVQFSGRLLIVDRQGNVVIDSDMETDNDDIVSMKNQKFIINSEKTDLKSILKNKENTVGYYIENNDKYYGAITFVPGVDWMVIVEQEEGTMLAEAFEIERKLSVLMIVVVIIAVIIGLTLAFSIIKPIGKLIEKVRSLSNGIKELDFTEVEKDSINEITELTKAFSEMSIILNKNITDLENSFEEQNRLQKYLNNILRSVANGIIVFNNRGNITIFNREAEKITGYSSKEVINLRLEEFMEILDIIIGKLFTDVVDKGEVFNDIEFTIKNRCKREIPISISASRVLDDNQQVIGVVFLLKDLSKMKLMERELASDDRIKTLGQLSASIIHDIGNPLAGIGNLIEVLKDNTNDKETKDEVLEFLGNEVEDLNNLVINFLDFTHESKLNKTSTAIQELLNVILNLLDSEIEEKNITVIKKFLETSVLVDVDRRAIKQGLINILKNAIHAVDEYGKIYIDFVIEGAKLNIIIEDNGKGIKEEDLDRIFFPFYTEKREGTGLGLFITYNIIKDHNGSIVVESEFGKGTKFIISIPIKEE